MMSVKVPPRRREAWRRLHVLVQPCPSKGHASEDYSTRQVQRSTAFSLQIAPTLPCDQGALDGLTVLQANARPLPPSALAEAMQSSRFSPSSLCEHRAPRRQNRDHHEDRDRADVIACILSSHPIQVAQERRKRRQPMTMPVIENTSPSTQSPTIRTSRKCGCASRAGKSSVWSAL
jgi:hypothetical protein